MTNYIPSEEEVSSLLQRLDVYRQTLSHYLLQVAGIGMVGIQPSIAYGINEARSNILKIKTILRDWNMLVDDHPDDYQNDPISRDDHKKDNLEDNTIHTTNKSSVITISKTKGHIIGRLVNLPHIRRLEIIDNVQIKRILKDKLEESNVWSEIARHQESLYDFLEWYYEPRGYKLHTRLDPRNGKLLRYPITTLEMPSSQLSNPESILNRLNPVKIEESEDQPSPFIMVDDWAWILRMALRPDRYLDDGIKYIMQSISRNPLRINGALGWYFDVLRTCDCLEREILDFFGKYDPSSIDFDSVINSLELRKKLHDEVDDPVLSGMGRSAALAMSVLMVYKHDRKYYALIKKRSSRTAVHSSLFHVAPSFMFAPEYSAWKPEWNVWHQFQREFLEEVIGEKSVEIPSSDVETEYDWFCDHPELKKLRALKERGKVKFYVTGITINLLNLRPEICALLIIDSPEWIMNTQISYNWEFMSDDESRDSGESHIFSVPIENDLDVLETVELTPENVVPPGGAALWLGIDLARKILKI